MVKIELPKFKDIEEHNKVVIISGMFFYILSIFLIIIIITFKSQNDINSLVLFFGLYFLLNILGIFIIIITLNKLIDKYKNEIIKLYAVKEILDCDKKDLFRIINQLKKNAKFNKHK